MSAFDKAVERRGVRGTESQLFVYKALALTLDIRGGRLSPEQEEALSAALRPVLAGPEPEFALAVACWLRDKNELGNRLIPIHILVRCAREEGAARALVRAAAPKILLIPSDITEAFGLSRVNGAKLPTCLKKAGKDLLENLTEFHAAKYDSRTKSKRLKAIVRACDKKLAAVAAVTVSPVMREKQERAARTRKEEALAKLIKLKNGDLQTLVRTCHAEAPPELMMRILQKRYPDNKEGFERAKLPGEFQEQRADERLRLSPPDTWERMLSKNGNTPVTWRDLLVAEPCLVGMTALLRNLRNILQMGFTLPFLEKHVFRKIRGGGGQTPVVLAQTLQQLKKDFSEEELVKMSTEGVQHRQNILSYYRVRKWLRTGRNAIQDGSGLGHFGEIAERLISEFLGYPLAESCGLARVGTCFLKFEKAKVRGGQTEVARKRCVPFHPPDQQVVDALQAAFLQGIQRASDSGTPAIPDAKQALLWLDLTPPPLAKGAAALGLDPKETHLCGLKDEDVPAVPIGRQVPLEQIITSPLLNFELQYACRSFIDYNLHAYDRNGKTLWVSTWCDCGPGREKKNSKGQLLAVHCRDICAGTETAPALRTLHVDLSHMEEEVFALCMSSQCYTGTMPDVASVCLREIPETQRAEVEALVGGHDPYKNPRGKPCLAASLTTALRSGSQGVGGSCTYAMIYRDVRKGGQKWLFRNLMNECLQSGTFVAVQINEVMKRIFQESVNAEAVLTVKDLDLPAYLRVCQLSQAFAKGGGGARSVITGVSWATQKVEAREVVLQGKILDDLAAIISAKSAFQDRAVPIEEAFLALAKLPKLSKPDVLLRVGNNPEFPTEAARKEWGGDTRLCALDMKGNIFEKEEALTGGHVSWLPGQTEGTVRLVCSALEGSGNLADYVRKFLPKPLPPSAAEGGDGGGDTTTDGERGAASSKFRPPPRSAKGGKAKSDDEAAGACSSGVDPSADE